MSAWVISLRLITFSCQLYISYKTLTAPVYGISGNAGQL